MKALAHVFIFLLHIHCYCSFILPGIKSTSTFSYAPKAVVKAGNDLDAKPLPVLTNEEIPRYARHLILPDCGVEGQRKLKASSVLCIGTGGLGSPLLLYLAAAGIGRLGIIDDDIVDESNLQRQIIHGTSQVGKPKVQSASARINEINPHVKVESYKEKFTSANAMKVVEDYDIVVDGSDNFPTKYLVNDACVLAGKPLVYGAILAFEGQASVFNYEGGPNYRDFLPDPPAPGAVPSCAEGGVFGVLPGVIGCIQATEVIKMILGKGEVLSGRILIYDALTMRFREVPLLPSDEGKKVQSLIDYQGFCGFSTKQPAEQSTVPEDPFTKMTVVEVAKKMAAGWVPYVLDVRLPQEADIVSLPFADSICPHRQVDKVAASLPRDQDILVHCKAGARSAKACRTLADLGFQRLYNMEGGIISWAQEIDKSMPLY
eukprot:CAMPEP_0113935720 /NCGR_PEP_ID=MMETSP1339-20121228/2818_1 /TAXON_ID=94617 /ORGANISM="Fibrocapsa japonica" /LENGTH=430 /DNA_ID=CAMNT_0000937963 /DNA_START=69 /DNA_END=1361 /DNA_ORIENTATION=+ /assembly_acc=CAM_ASM_000762